MTFEEYELSTAPQTWRILWQITAMQVEDHNLSKSNEEKLQWKTRILETLERMNKRAQLFNPQSIPSELPPPTDFWRVQNALTGNWCVVLIEQLTSLFTSATIADTSRTNE